MLAFDAVRKLMGKGHGEVIPLRAFVAQLLPLDIPDDEAVLNNCIPDHLRDASIACNQLVYLPLPLILDKSLQLAERHSGGVLHEYYHQLDIFLPILYKDIAAVLVQVDDFDEQDTDYLESILKCLRPTITLNKSN